MRQIRFHDATSQRLFFAAALCYPAVAAKHSDLEITIHPEAARASQAEDLQSNIVDIGIKPGTNVSNVKGSIDALYPSSDPNFGLGLQASIMLHAGTFTAGFNIGPSAGPFDVAAVGDAGGAVISIDPTLSCTNSSGLDGAQVASKDVTYSVPYRH